MNSLIRVRDDDKTYPQILDLAKFRLNYYGVFIKQEFLE
jgi:hypothetical protein